MMEKFNFSRKLFHLIGFFVPAILFFDMFRGSFHLVYASRTLLFICIVFIILFMGSIEIVRLNYQPFNNFYLNNFGKLMKEAEKNRMNGVIPYMLSNAIVVAFFPSEIIFLSMAYLLIGDPVAAFFGSKYGKYRFYNGKSLVGVVSFVTASTISGIALMGLFGTVNQEYPLTLFKEGAINFSGLLIIFLGSISAGVAEFLSGHALGGFLEDNLLIPLVSSSITTLLISYSYNISIDNLLFDYTNLFLQTGNI